MRYDLMSGTFWYILKKYTKFAEKVFNINTYLLTSLLTQQLPAIDVIVV